MKRTFLFLLPALLYGFEPALLSRTPADTTGAPFASANGRFYAEITYSAGASGFVPIDRFVLHDRAGGVVYEKTKFGHTLIDIANNGTVVGIDFDGPGSGRAVLHFYAPGGAELGTASIGFLRATAFASNGSVYCVNDGINGLRVFTPDGTELYDLGTGNWFAVSADGARIALARDDGIEVFVRGASTGRIPIASPFIRQMTFSPDGWELAFIDRGSLSLYRVASLTGQFRYLELNPRLSFTSVDISSENPVVLAGLDEDLGEGMPARHTRGFVYLFDTSGHRLWSDEVDYKDWNAHMPEVLFTGSRAFRVRTLDNVSEYRY